jgi:S1-C subfamily serine protease
MTRERSSASHLIAGALGGLIAVVVGAILIATGVIDTDDDDQGSAPAARTERPQAEGGAGPSGATVNEIYRRTDAGVAFVSARVRESGESPIPGFPNPRGDGRSTGSGFALDAQGYVLTNAHVVEGARDVSVRFGDEGAVEAKVVGRDASTDLAVLKIDPKDAKFRPIPLGDSSKVRVGDQTIAIGNPFGLEHTVTTGIVSAVQRSIESPNGFSIPDAIQTDASINPGNSGGPLLDGNGRVIGVNAQIATGGGGGGSVGIGFAIPINLAKRVVPELKSEGDVEHAYIGVTTADVRDTAEDLNLPVDHGALVQDVVDGSPADKAGLRAGRTETADGLVIGGDLIVKADGEEVMVAEDIAAAITDRRPGDRITVEYYRGGKLRKAELTLAKRPKRAPSIPGDPGGGQDEPDEPDQPRAPDLIP